MSKKFKELPGFETNEFKKDDWVRVYQSANFYDFTVYEVISEKVLVNGDIKGIGDFHFKQCRKLVPREYWIFKNTFEHKSFLGIDRIYETKLETKPDKDMEDFYVKVREVSDD